MSKLIAFHPTDSIPEDHWAIKCQHGFKVAVINVNGFDILVKINPTDRRGYRLIVQLHNEDMKSTFNRQWTGAEMTSVFEMGALLSGFYYDIGLVPQIVYAGNNSMEQEGDSVLIGRKEPAMCHIHVFGRGIPDKEYINGIKLQCPKIGEEFNLKGNGDEKENMKKLPWSDDQLIAFKTMLLNYIGKRVNVESIELA